MESCFDDADKVAPIDCCRQQSMAIDSTLQPFNFSTFQPSSCHLSLGFRLDPAPPPADNSSRCPLCAPTPPPQYRHSRKQANFPMFFRQPNSLSPSAETCFGKFSIQWKHVSGTFPHNGKLFSTLWQPLEAAASPGIACPLSRRAILQLFNLSTFQPRLRRARRAFPVASRRAFC